MPYDVGVRSYLQGKGVDSGSIGYDQNSGNVTVNNQPFYKPELNMAGTTYSSQSNLDNAYQNYTKSQQPQNNGMFNAASSAAGVDAGAGQGSSSAGNGQGTSGTGQTTQYTNPYTQQIADLMKHLSDTSGAPQQDIYSSPQYAAAQANQARQSQLAVRQANEQAAGAGLGHSTIMTDRAQRIQDDSNNYLQTQLVPQIMSQLQAQRQQELTNQQSQLNDYMNLANHADSEHQNQIANSNADRTFQAGRQDAATAATGYYNPSGMTMEQINQQIAANGSAWKPNPTNDPAIALNNDKVHQENIRLNGLLGKTYDPSTGTYSGGTGQVGTRTLAGQTLDLNNAKDMAVLTGKMPDGTPTNAAQQQQLTNQWTLAEQTGTIPNSLADFYGLPHGMQTQAAKNQAAQLGISQQNATNSANSSTNSNNNAKINQLMEVWKNTGVAPAGLESVGVKQGDKYTGGNPSSTGNFNLDDYKGHINSVFYSNEPSDPNDPLSPKTKVFDKAAAQKYVDSLNLPKDQKNQLYQIYGLQAVSDSDISQYLK